MTQIGVVHGFAYKFLYLFDLVNEGIAMEKELLTGSGNIPVIHEVVEHDVTQISTVSPVIPGEGEGAGVA